MNELLLMCMIAGRRAAIPAIRVQSVIEIAEITPIPGAPSFIRGLTALRSQALTVIDCPVALGLEPGETPAQQRAAVVDIEGHLYALLVDAAYDVGEARSEPIEVPGGFGPGWQAAARQGTPRLPILAAHQYAAVAGPSRGHPGAAPGAAVDTAAQMDTAAMNLEDIDAQLKDPSKLSVEQIKQLKQVLLQEPCTLTSLKIILKKLMIKKWVLSILDPKENILIPTHGTNQKRQILQ